MVFSCKQLRVSVNALHRIYARTHQRDEIANVNLFSKRQRITLCLLYAIGRPSVVCLSSVTLVHPTQAVELFGNFFFTIR